MVAAGLSADRKCFEQFNSQGSINGHCGLDANNNYVRCESESVFTSFFYFFFILIDRLVTRSLFLLLFFFFQNKRHVMCGSLQCQMGTRNPMMAGMDQMYSRTLVSMAGREFECK